MKLLVVIDMQKDFISGVLGNPETAAVLPRVCERVKKALNEGERILCTLDTHYEDYMETQEGRNLPVPHCIKGTDGWELEADLKGVLGNMANDVTIEKITFGSKDLPLAAAAEGNVPDEIELIGVCTDICVISNAMILKAYFPEVPIKVNAACCAGTSPEAHNRALEAMKMCQIEMI